MEATTTTILGFVTPSWLNGQQATTPDVEAQNGESKTQLENGSCNGTCLKNRACFYLKAAPSVIVLVSLVLAVVAALVWKQNSLAITFGFSTLCSIYGVYTAFNAANLQTFEESNIQLKESIKRFEAENLRLKDQVDAFKDELLKMSEITKKLEETEKQVKKLKQENEQLEKVREELQNQLLELTKVQLAIEAKTQALDKINQSLDGVQRAATLDHKNLGTNISTLVQEVEKLQSFRTEYTSGASELEQKMKEQIGHLSNTILGILTEVSKWKEEGAVKQQMEHLQLLNQMTKEAELKQKQIEEKQREREIELQSVQKQIIEAKSKIESLQQIQKQFSESLSTLLSHIDGLSKEKSEIREAAKVLSFAAEQFSNLNKRNSVGNLTTGIPPQMRSGLNLTETTVN